jgi:hypothetical protein
VWYQEPDKAGKEGRPCTRVCSMGAIVADPVPVPACLQVAKEAAEAAQPAVKQVQQAVGKVAQVGGWVGGRVGACGVHHCGGRQAAATRLLPGTQAVTSTKLVLGHLAKVFLPRNDNGPPC